MSELAAQLDLLWQLRDLDAQAYSATQRAARAGREQSAAELAESQSRKRHDAAMQSQRDLEKRERDTEHEIKQLQKRLGAEEDQSNSATSESIRKHSLDALEKSRKQLDDLENTGLALLEQIEKAKTTVTTAAEAIKVASARTVQLRQAHEVEQAAAKAKLAELQPGRDALASRLDDALRQSYESARTKYPDSPICSVGNSVCAGCGGELTLHHATRVRARTEIMRCPHCMRLHDERG
ncbi:MAG: hypothetical protein IPP14_15855 [Planctomycetes bacterium]|nr:hypothetical protein [Planctomycetota bacterium]